MNSTRPQWLISLAACVGGWAFAAIVMTGAQMLDAQRRGVDVGLWRELPGNLVYFVPLMALSWGLDRLFASRRELISAPAAVFALYLTVGFIFFPLYVVYETAAGLVLSWHPLNELWTSLMDERRMGWWSDFMIVSGAFALHVAVAAWRSALDRERALAVARADNLQLRLTQLQGQLEPHFLFNALSGISALVRSGDRAEALTALSQVSDLLRYALRASKDAWVSVQDEIDFVDEYLSIQLLRFGDKLKISKAYCDEEWDRYSSPPLLFQPLIENAVRHGLEPRPDGASIEISLSLADGMIRFEVINDIGDSERGAGVGLATTRQRLTALYGERATLEAGEADGRYRAALSLPATCDD